MSFFSRAPVAWPFRTRLWGRGLLDVAAERCPRLAALWQRHGECPAGVGIGGPEEANPSVAKGDPYMAKDTLGQLFRSFLGTLTCYGASPLSDK